MILGKGQGFGRVLVLPVEAIHEQDIQVEPATHMSIQTIDLERLMPMITSARSNFLKATALCPHPRRLELVEAILVNKFPQLSWILMGWQI